MVGLLVSQVSVFVCAVRLLFVIRACGRRASLAAIYRVHLRSLFYFVFVPFSIGADVAKLAMLSTFFPERREHALAAVISDRFLGFLTFVLISLLAFIPTSRTLVEGLGIVRGYAVVGAVLFLVGAAFFVMSKVRSRGLRERIEAFLAAARHSSRWVGTASVYSILMQLFMCTAVYVAAVSFRISIPWSHVTFVVSSAMLFQIVPVSVAGIGAAEVVAVGLYLAVGLARADAILLASTAFTYKLFTAMIGGTLEYAGALKEGRERLGGSLRNAGNR